MSIEQVVLVLISAGISVMGWLLKRYIQKVDDFEGRLTRVETVLDILGDIRNDLGAVKTDVEVIKSTLGR